ncbi:fragile X messenger ribonucleoprotein 1 homolog [Artemia franciscana]
MEFIFLMEDLLVEVLLDDGHYYEAILTDVTDTEIVVTFENMLTVMGGRKDLETKNYPFAKARLPPLKDTTGAAPSYAEGQEIEVYYTLFGYYRATIKEILIDGEFFSVQHFNPEYPIVTYYEIVPVDRIRVPNPNPPLTKDDFVKFHINIPTNLRDIAKKYRIHKDFQLRISAAICRFEPGSGDLVCISRDDWSQKAAYEFIDIHINTLREKAEGFKKLEEKAIQLRSKLEEEEFFKEWTERIGENIHVSTSEQSTSGLGEQEIQFSVLNRTEEEHMLVESKR